jgi:hypothetical protein
LFSRFSVLSTIHFTHDSVPENVVSMQKEWVAELASRCKALRRVVVDWESKILIRRKTHYVQRSSDSEVSSILATFGSSAKIGLYLSLWAMSIE